MARSTLVFDPFSQEFFDDPYETYRWMRSEAPVYYSERYDFYALTRHADVAAAFKDPATYSSAYGVELSMVRAGRRRTCGCCSSWTRPNTVTCAAC